MPSAPACALVIFGASGDLAKRKLIPAVYELAKENLFNERSYILGFARSEMSDEQFRAECRESIAKYGRSKSVDGAVWKGLESRIYYARADYDSAADFARVAARLRFLDEQYQTGGNHLYYLATPPAAFQPIIHQLGQLAREGSGRSSQNSVVSSQHGNSLSTDYRLPTTGYSSQDPGESFARVIIEKPFGRDLPSARALNQLVHRYFREEQVFRIDHYLGKETVQNLLVMRFANSIFEPIWNYKYIDHIQITVAETLGVGGRGGYYDRAGALRDMVQNHMFQLMALVAMEPPVALDAASIRDEKVKVFRAIRPIRAGLVEEYTVRGQYGAAASGLGSRVSGLGTEQSLATEGYLKEKDVPADSRTETFAAVKLFVDNWRWSGMPFYLRTGKYLPEKVSEVVVRFRSPPLTLFQKQCEAPVYPNDLIIRVQPDEGISLRLNGKVPGGQMNIKPVALDFLYATTFHKEAPEAYERLIHDAMVGDQTLFIRADEVEAAWSVIDPIEQGWAESKKKPYEYAPGTWGPKEAQRLIEVDGRRWLHSNGAPEPIIACSL